MINHIGDFTTLAEVLKNIIDQALESVSEDKLEHLKVRLNTAIERSKELKTKE